MDREVHNRTVARRPSPGIGASRVARFLLLQRVMLMTDISWLAPMTFGATLWIVLELAKLSVRQGRRGMEAPGPRAEAVLDRAA